MSETSYRPFDEPDIRHVALQIWHAEMSLTLALRECPSHLITAPDIRDALQKCRAVLDQFDQHNINQGEGQ